METYSMIIFFDLDGVLIPGKAYYMPGQTWPLPVKFDPCAVGLLNSLAQKLEAKLVLHSNWRNTEARRSERDMRPLTDWLLEQGIQERHLHPVRPQCPVRKTRWLAISDWFSGEECRYQRERVIVLDDERCPQDWRFRDRLYVTDFDEGLTYAIYKQILGDCASG